MVLDLKNHEALRRAERSRPPDGGITISTLNVTAALHPVPPHEPSVTATTRADFGITTVDPIP